MPLPHILSGLCDCKFWEDFLRDKSDISPGVRRKIEIYNDLVQSGAILEAVDELIDCRYRFDPPTRHMIDKKGTSRKKVVYTYSPRDELLLKGVNFVLQEFFATYISTVCHSFQRGKGARTAFRSILRDREIDSKFCLRLDIRNYFNSVNVADFFDRLPDGVKSEKVIDFILRSVLLDNRAVTHDGELVDDAKGLMAGTPLAPVLSNIYLRDLDEKIRAEGVTYVRYSDDIIVFAHEPEFSRCKEIIFEHLESCGLSINTDKTKIIEPGEPWEYLGFRYSGGMIDISAVTLAKAKGRIRRLAKRYDRFRAWKNADPEDAARRFIRRVDRKHYGIALDGTDLCWSQWFFPVINTSRTLKEFDSFVQEKIRFVASGGYNKKSYKVIPYSKMRDLGYIPLTTAYYLYKNDPEEYFEVITDRAQRSLLEFRES